MVTDENLVFYICLSFQDHNQNDNNGKNGINERNCNKW